MRLTADLPVDRRLRVDTRLQTNLMAWLTTVSPAGRPDSVPVWFLLRDDDSILVYSQPRKAKLRNIDANPNVALGLDVTDIGRDVIRIEGTAVRATNQPPADRVPEYVAKYVERIGAIFGTPEGFAAAFSEAIVITPRKLHA
jgi:PPOX class probable F420-dependent enzyme